MKKRINPDRAARGFERQTGIDPENIDSAMKAALSRYREDPDNVEYFRAMNTALDNAGIKPMPWESFPYWIEEGLRSNEQNRCARCNNEGTACTFSIRGLSLKFDARCCAIIIIEELNVSEDKFFAYMSGDGKFLTDFLGNVIARITDKTTKRVYNSYYSSHMHYWRAVDLWGRSWYGRGLGPGMSTGMKLKKDSRMTGDAMTALRISRGLKPYNHDWVK